MQFKSFGRKSAVLPQGDGQAAQSGETMDFCLWICSTRSLAAEEESEPPGATDARAAKRTGAVPAGISFASDEGADDSVLLRGAAGGVCSS